MVILMARVMVTAMVMVMDMGAMEVHTIKIINDLFGLGLKN